MLKKIGILMMGVGIGFLILATGGGGVRAASQFPTKPIKLLVGFGAGGGTDVISRKIAAEMEKVLGQPVVVINKPGGGGLVSWKELVASKPGSIP
jgi:tripartite-type tricarboxylate transporter receptor subunit TctC